MDENGGCCSKCSGDKLAVWGPLGGPWRRTCFEINGPFISDYASRNDMPLVAAYVYALVGSGYVEPEVSGQAGSCVRTTDDEIWDFGF